MTQYSVLCGCCYRSPAVYAVIAGMMLPESMHSAVAAALETGAAGLDNCRDAADAMPSTNGRDAAD